MVRSYKWLGGIGYILSFIPYASFISSILVAVAWILMGKDTRERIFTILGVLMLITYVLAIALIIWLILSFLPVAFAGTMAIAPRAMTTPWKMGEVFGRFFAQIIGMIIIGLVLVGLAITVFILDIVAHFRAGRIFDNRWFKIAGWMRIILAIAIIIAIPLTVFMIISSGPSMLPSTPFGPSYGAILSLLFTILWPMLIALVVGLLATIFSIIAFFTISEEATTTQSSSQLQQQ